MENDFGKQNRPTTKRIYEKSKNRRPHHVAINECGGDGMFFLTPTKRGCENSMNSFKKG